MIVSQKWEKAAVLYLGVFFSECGKLVKFKFETWDSVVFCFLWFYHINLFVGECLWFDWFMLLSLHLYPNRVRGKNYAGYLNIPYASIQPDVVYVLVSHISHKGAFFYFILKKKKKLVSLMGWILAWIVGPLKWIWQSLWSMNISIDSPLLNYLPGKKVV